MSKSLIYLRHPKNEIFAHPSLFLKKKKQKQKLKQKKKGSRLNERYMYIIGQFEPSHFIKQDYPTCS